jgi:PAS domain S-box-containing protein
MADGAAPRIPARGSDIVDWTSDQLSASPEPVAGRHLAALRTAGLLDAPVDERFDRLTRLARRLLRTPVALVSLLDAERQFFLSAQGLPEPWAGLRETPLSHSFCRSVVETGLPLSVGDAREDPRVRGNPAVEALGVVAYLAAPLALPDGCVVGALCAIDSEPRAWTAEDERALADLAGAVMAEVAAGPRLRELEAAGAALRESEGRYRALFEAIDAGFCIVEVKFDRKQRPIDYRFVEVNPAFEGQTGLPDAVGRWMRELAPDHEQHWFDTYGRVASTGESLRFENVAAALGRWYDVYAFRVGAPEAHRVGILFNDISGRRRAEAALRESEARYRALFEVSPQIVWFADAEGRCTYVNQHYTDFVGLAADRAVGEGWAAALHPEDRGRVRATWAGAVASGGRYEAEFRVRRASDGSYRWHLFKGAPLRGPDGRVERWIGVGMDVDDRRRAEAALRGLIEALGVAVYTTDPTGRLTFYNEAAAALWGWRPPLGDARWCGGWRLYRTDGAAMPHEECPMAVALRENRPVRGEEAVAEQPDGTRVPFIPYPTPLRDEAGALVGAVNVLVDITQRKAAEAALRRRSRKLNPLSEAAAGLLAAGDPDELLGSLFRSMSEEFGLDLSFGFAAEEGGERLRLTSCFGVPEEERAELGRLGLGHAICGTVARSRRAMHMAEVRASTDPKVAPVRGFGIRAFACFPLVAGGRLFGTLFFGSRSRDRFSEEDLALLGTIAQYVAVVRERARAEAALREGEARLRSILETVPDAMVVVDDRGIIESFSTGAARLFGYATKEAVGRGVGMLTPSRDDGWHDGSFARHAATGEPKAALGADQVVVGRRKDGSTFPMELAVGEVRADGRRLFTGFMRDLTRRRATEARVQELQAELLHVSRLSAAGEMASALAHELNQPLTAATSAVRAARRMLIASSPDGPRGPAAEIHEAMDLAAEQALRAGQIVRRLRDFVARGEADKRLEDLARLVEEAGALALVGARERGVHITLHLAPGLPAVIVDRIQLQQVLFNLLRNALEAMGDEAPAGDGGGPPPRRELVVTATPAGPEVVEVAVSDTGPGLAPEVAGRLFESFVSTKPGGMGMGLSICRTIVEAHGGRLWAEPNPDGGTVFRFTLPAAPLEGTAC